MAGVFLGLAMMPSADPSKHVAWVGLIRKIGLGLVFIYLAVLLPVFAFAVHPSAAAAILYQ